MSTTFAIIKENREGEKIRYDIAHRSGIGGGKVKIEWFNITFKSLIEMLRVEEFIKLGCKDCRLLDVRVHAMDNTAQGVKDIGDLITLDKYGRLDKVELKNRYMKTIKPNRGVNNVK